MKIALVVHDLQDSPGHSRYAKILANELSREHEVGVFANGCEARNGARWSFNHVRAWRSTALTCVQTFPLGMRSHESTLARFQIQHSQGYCGGNPNVVTAHICVAAYLDSLKDVSVRHRLSLQLMATAESRFYRGYSGQVIAVSQKVSDELRKFYEFAGPVRVIPHGVDGRRFNVSNREKYRETTRQELNITADQTLALYVGDLTKSHTHLKALSAAAPAIQFVIITATDAYHWLAPNVQILPPSSALERYYAAADAFVFPTTYDSFGMVVLEAMASGLPVFCSDQAGVSELIETGHSGFVFPLHEWVERTEGHLRNLRAIASVGNGAGETARRQEWSSVVKATKEVYSGVATAAL
jgi:UDP-glucose:(heptosyl)LPS alpha-1,3-glucosyltransferase